MVEEAARHQLLHPVSHRENSKDKNNSGNSIAKTYIFLWNRRNFETPNVGKVLQTGRGIGKQASSNPAVHFIACELACLWKKSKKNANILTDTLNVCQYGNRNFQGVGQNAGCASFWPMHRSSEPSTCELNPNSLLYLRNVHLYVEVSWIRVEVLALSDNNLGCDVDILREFTCDPATASPIHACK